MYSGLGNQNSADAQCWHEDENDHTTEVCGYWRLLLKRPDGHFTYHPDGRIPGTAENTHFSTLNAILGNCALKSRGTNDSSVINSLEATEEFPLKIEILPDYWARYETRWEILDSDGSTVIAQGGGSEFTAYELYEHDVTLTYLHGSGLYYTFRIIDDYGDGLNWYTTDHGYFKLSIYGREMHGSTDGVHFGYGTELKFDRYYEYSPVFTFEVVIHPDEWASGETSWELLDIDGSTVLAQGGYSDFTAYEIYSFPVEGLTRYCNTNSFYTFRIMDDFGDGLHWTDQGPPEYYEDYYYWYYFNNGESTDQEMKKEKKSRGDKATTQDTSGTFPGSYTLFDSGTMLPETDSLGVDFGYEDTIQFQGCF